MKWLSTKDSRIKKRGDTYYARFSKRGIRVEDSLYTTSFSLAVDLCNRLEKALLNNEDHKEVLAGKDLSGVPLIEELWVSFIDDKTKGNPKKKIEKARPRTIVEYNNFWDRYFKDFWGLKRLDEINEDTWEKYIEYAQNKSLKKDRLKLFNHWKYVSAFLTWSELTGHLKEKRPNIYNPDPTTFQDELEDQDGIGKNYSDTELELLRIGSRDNVELHLWVLIAQFMGNRSSEITQLKKDRIHFSSNLIKLRKSDTKTKQARSVWIHHKVLPLLKKQVEATDSDYVFPNRVDKSRPMDPTGFKKAWDKLREETGVEGRFHDLRHSHATRAFGNKRLNPVTICKSLGMSMATAMKHYIHFSETELSSLNEFAVEVEK